MQKQQLLELLKNISAIEGYLMAGPQNTGHIIDAYIVPASDIIYEALEEESEAEK